MSTLENFDFFNRAVQSGLTEGQFINAESIVLAMGPPTLASMSVSDPDNPVALNQAVAFPVGKVQQFSLGFNLAWQRIFEIGSKRSYFISGRAVGSIGMGRVHYHGPSLGRVLYAYMAKDGSSPGSIEIPPLYDNGAVMDNVNPHDVKIRPGSGTNGNLWYNLASDVFQQPTGMLMIIKDSNDQTVGAFYFEYCVVPTLGLQFDAQSLAIQEQTQLLFERMVPINHESVVPLMGTVDNPYGIIGQPTGINA